MKARKIAAPKKGRVCSFAVFIDETVPWDQAIRTLEPQFDDGQEEMVCSKAGDHFSPSEFQGARKVILVNFREDLSDWVGRDDMLAWAKQERLRPASPRTIFSLCHEHPHLVEELHGELTNMEVVSLAPCVLEDPDPETPWGVEQWNCFVQWWFGEPHEPLDVPSGWSTRFAMGDVLDAPFGWLILREASRGRLVNPCDFIRVGLECEPNGDVESWFAFIKEAKRK